MQPHFPPELLRNSIQFYSNNIHATIILVNCYTSHSMLEAPYEIRVASDVISFSLNSLNLLKDQLIK